ncbi:MAG: 50S ribosomal protein L4 [Gemmataceae bacterium]|nr:50S ribosomal protein L4 [Gemmataceae bacterium]
MLKIDVVNQKGEAIGSVEINPAEFGGEVKPQLLHDVVIMYLANQRAGTHSTLRRGEVSGSTKKLFRQKGTGNARVGNKRTNKRRGGGTAKGPKPRDYEYHLPKKAVQAATRMAILSKIQDHEALVIDDLGFPNVKTRQIRELLKNLKLDKTTCLMGTVGINRNLYLSARNLPNVEVMPANQFNAYTLLKQKRLLLTRAALDELRKSRS